MPAKYLLDNSKSAAAYRAQRLQSLMQNDPMHAVADAAGAPTFKGSDPITAALEAHGNAFRKPKKQITGSDFFSPNTKWS
mmetsp:Transcript_1936/g.4529  ORF Transcript_1936/g.4529 Transcript_1936/m.4529 type:complete len:80 (+) Transcript_1936:41-280(+)|eukprot:CAMPEP_0206253494 /NCGR_PEP_ID=MMETSP0047_2-20121206/23181_1 /ASSEMBLY_ACC=CAM_ASM_000192 /TAXON_ID=195065 /ORGANISM="Chroomonas mesostigmatica_cf, Strain CCMP1168" /LENGTH=79 /DNA_ID=CAMNT_0053679705 /DNA_START=36 /DNA_END=275 /DNA_ORIENTATION=+